jgi:AcrR family transcriptional regulator
MGRPRKFENRSEVILNTAARLFLEKGFDGTTMDEIARESDLGKATLYAEFASKEALMAAVIQRYIQQAHTEMREAIAKANGNYLTVLHKLLMNRVLTIYERANKHFHNAEIMLAARQEFRDRMKEHWDEEFRIIGTLLEKAALNGEMAPSENYFRLAKLLRKGLAGLYPPHIFDIQRADYEQEAHAIIGLYVAGLTVRPV